MPVTSPLPILLYAFPLFATLIALYSLHRFLQGKRGEAMAVRKELEGRKEQSLADNRRLDEENKDLAEKVGQIQKFYEITREMGTTLEFESTFQIFSRRLREMFSFERTVLIILEGEDEKVRIKRILEVAGEVELEGKREAVKEGDSSLEENLVNLFVGEQKGSIFIGDTSQSFQARRLSLPKRIKSFAAIPLMVENKMIAIMTMENMKEDNLDQLSVVAAQLALDIKKTRLYQRVQELSIVDGLTGTFLRRHFLERFKEELQRSRYHQLSLSFLMADIDHFKDYNDKYGHLVGDVVLKDIAHLLQEGVREIDLVGRYGGEEFALLLPETDKESAFQVADRLRISVEEHRFSAYDEEVGEVTISLGLATFPGDAREVKELIDKADLALYKAKQSGRNRVSTFS